MTTPEHGHPTWVMLHFDDSRQIDWKTPLEWARDAVNQRRVAGRNRGGR